MSSEEGIPATAAAADGQTIQLWTAQAPVVVDTIRRDGVSMVKREYIDAKYGEVAWSFKTAYSFFTQWAQQRVPKPEGADSAIWLYRSQDYSYPAPGGYSLMLEVPRDKCVLFDLRVWNKILNLHYVGDSREDERAFQKELDRIGVRQPADLFSTPFYPVQKRKVQDSWQKLFTSAENCPDRYIQAGVWELRQGWVKFCVRIEDIGQD